MQTGYTFQRIMRDKMEAEGWSQREVARMATTVVGRTVYASQIGDMLRAKPSIPAGDIMQALARLMNADPALFITSAYASRYSANELLGMSEFVREEFEKADEATRRRIIEILREGK